MKPARYAVMLTSDELRALDVFLRGDAHLWSVSQKVSEARIYAEGAEYPLLPVSEPPEAPQAPLKLVQRRAKGPLKTFSGVYSARSVDEACHRDGRSEAQVRTAVRATSQKRAAELLNCGLGHLKDFMGQGGNAETNLALDQYPPETILVKPLDAGGTVQGQTGWVPSKHQTK